MWSFEKQFREKLRGEWENKAGWERKPVKDGLLSQILQ